MGARLISPAGTRNIVVVGYSTSLNMGSSSGTARKYRTFFAIRATQGNLRLDVQLRSPEDLIGLQKFIRQHQVQSLDSPSPKGIRIVWESQAMDYEGFVLTQPGGLSRFQHAPTASLDFLLTKDLINTTTGLFSTATRPEEIYRGELPGPEDVTGPIYPPGGGGTGNTPQIR